MSQEKFEKSLRKKTLLVIGIILIILGILLAVLLVNDAKKEKENPITMYDNIHLYNNESLKYDTVNVSLMLDAFATLDEKKAYFVFDENYNAYIAVLNTDAQNQLRDILEYTYSSDDTLEKPNPVTIKGISKTIPSDLKKLAIDYYNKTFEEANVQESNASLYFGSIYLDTYEDPMSNTGIPFIVIGSMISIVGLVLVIVHFSNKKRTKKYLEKYQGELEKIQYELDNPNTLYYKKQKLYLTNKYLISMMSGIKIIEYKDVIWIYPQDHYVNGIPSNRSILIMTNDFKIHSIATTGLSKKQNVLFDEMYNNISVNLPNALKGYSKENQDKIKEMKK